MKFTIGERINIINLLPAKGSMIEQMTSKAIFEKMMPTSEEKDAVGWTNQFDGTGGNRSVWDSEKDIPVEISLSKTEWEILKDAVAKADKEKTITIANVDICHKIKSYDVDAAEEALKNKTDGDKDDKQDV